MAAKRLEVPASATAVRDFALQDHRDTKRLKTEYGAHIPEENNVEQDREYIYTALRKLKLLEHLIAVRLSEIQAIYRKAQSVVYHQPETQLTSYRNRADPLMFDINARIEIYAATSCLSTCTMMYNKLPRELRDMVYTYIVGSESTLSIENDFLGPLVYNWKHTQHDTSDHLPDVFRYGMNAEFAHAFDRKFVGAHFKFELVEIWYRATTFVFRDCRFVPHFLENDRLGYCTEPRDRLNKVTIARDLYPKHELVRDLHLLSGLHAGAHITFEIRTMAFIESPPLSSTGNYMVMRAVRGVSIMFAQIRILLDKGHKVFVKVERLVPFEVVKEDLTKEAWSRKSMTLRRME